jgi:predicted DNA-binding transcriptional regulator AlpA
MFRMQIKMDMLATHTMLFDKKIWLLSDVVTFTGYSKQTIYNLVSLKEIPHTKKRNRLVFIPQEILNWMFNGGSK